MATRILILTPEGTPLFAMDGHHGAAHAQRWIADTQALLREQGITDTVAVEITPEQGGDAVRREVIGQIHRLRLETRRRPCGAREITALNLLADPQDADDLMRAAIATPQRVPARLHLVHAPADYAGPRRPIRIPRGRMEPPPGFPATPQEARLRRRIERRSAQK